jgi:5'-deoxynucleotidase YfbR-like HD superfamily hydrolase
MTAEVFSELDGRLSVVKRWTVINTIQTQSIAEHCFNVERIARRIAQDWFSVNSAESLDELTQIALHHDDDEAVTGDIPAPSKWVLGEKYLDTTRDLWYNRDGALHRIVKLADKMEAFWFMVMEAKLGNQYVKNYQKELEYKIYAVARNSGPTVEAKAREWVFVVQNMEGTTRGSAPSTDQSTGSSQR